MGLVCTLDGVEITDFALVHWPKDSATPVCVVDADLSTTAAAVDMLRAAHWQMLTNATPEERKTSNEIMKELNADNEIDIIKL